MGIAQISLNLRVRKRGGQNRRASWRQTLREMEDKRGDILGDQIGENMGDLKGHKVGGTS